MQQIAAAKSVSVSQIINSPNRPLHKYSFCFFESVTSALRHHSRLHGSITAYRPTHVSGTNVQEQAHINTNTWAHIHMESYKMTDTRTYTQLGLKVAVTRAHLLSIAIDCDVITHSPPSAALPLALLWPWSILFEVIIASTLLPTTENERVREWLWRTWGPQPPCPHSLATSHTHVHKFSWSTITGHTRSCAVHLCSVHCQHWACHAYSPSSKLWDAMGDSLLQTADFWIRPSLFRSKLLSGPLMLFP